MKKIGTHTVRGTMEAASSIEHKINLFDGKFNTGYKITKFIIAPNDMDNTNARKFVSKLATTPDLPIRINWNWDDAREIAWAVFSFDANVANDNGTPFNFVDPENLVIEDLYIYADEPAGSTTNLMNYYIEMDKYDFSDSLGALTMASEKAVGGD